MMVVRSLAWFEDAEAEPDPVELNERDWEAVRMIVSNALRKLESILRSYGGCGFTPAR